MAAPRRTPTRTTATTTGQRRSAVEAPSSFAISAETARSLVGIVLLVTGAVTLIALMLPGQGLLNRYVSEILRPAFGQGAWLLPMLLIVAGAFVERAPSVGNGWRVTAVGGFVVFLGALGLIQLLTGQKTTPEGLRQGGGAVGQALSGTLAALVSAPGAFVVLLGLLVAGLLLLFNLTVRGLLRPVASSGRAIAGALAVPVRVAAQRGRRLAGDGRGCRDGRAPWTGTRGRRGRTGHAARRPGWR